MKTPKYFEQMLERRSKLALDLISVCADVDEWLTSRGADLTDPDLTDSTLSGCMIYAEPGSAQQNVLDYVRNKM